LANVWVHSLIARPADRDQGLLAIESIEVMRVI
jgi:hypothetical protein